MPRRFAAQIVLMLTIAFVPAAAHAAVPVPCDVLTPQTASSLAGAPAKKALGSDVVCIYAADANGAQVSLTISAVTASFGAEYVKIAHDGPIKADVLTGVGDEAFYAVKDDDQNVVIAFYHLKMISLGVKRKPDAALKAAMIQAMKQLVPKV